MNSNHYFPHDHDEHGTRERVEEEAGALHRNSFDNQVEVVQALAGVENLAEDMEVESLNFIKHCHKKCICTPVFFLLEKKSILLKGKLNQKERVNMVNSWRLTLRRWWMVVVVTHFARGFDSRESEEESAEMKAVWNKINSTY